MSRKETQIPIYRQNDKLFFYNARFACGERDTARVKFIP